MAKVSTKITITISPAAPPALSIDASKVPIAGQVGVEFSGEVDVNGGVPPDSLSITDGALPPGLSMDADGKISGTPTQDGAFTAEITAVDSLG